MTHPDNNNDERLVEFLRQHRPDVPPASPDLEQLVMLQTVAPPSLLNSARHWRRLWVVPPAIAAGLLIVWTGYRILMPASLSAAQLASLNSFLENNWDGMSGSSADTQTFPLANPVNN